MRTAYQDYPDIPYYDNKTVLQSVAIEMNEAASPDINDIGRIRNLTSTAFNIYIRKQLFESENDKQRLYLGCLIMRVIEFYLMSSSSVVGYDILKEIINLLKELKRVYSFGNSHDSFDVFIDKYRIIQMNTIELSPSLSPFPKAWRPTLSDDRRTYLLEGSFRSIVMNGMKE